VAVEPAARQGRCRVLPEARERTAITSIRLGSDVAGLSAWQYLSTDSASFAAYLDARANRRDPFYVRPAGGVDICNVPVPVRVTPAR
jgi:peptidylprolyl isomerase